MDVKDAVKLAKEYVSEVYSEESIRDLGLEETEFDEAAGEWTITIGFRRPFERRIQKQDNSISSIFRPNAGYENRWYKSVQINSESGKIVRMLDRVLSNAA